MVPAVQRARERVRPRRADDPRRARRRRVGRQRPEAVEHERPPRRLRPAPRPHRLGRAQAPRHHLLRAADAPAGRRGPPAAPDERPRLVQRGVPHRRPGAGTTTSSARPGDGWRVGADDARPRAQLRDAAPAAASTPAGGPGRPRGRGRGRRVLRDLRLVPAAGRPARPRRRGRRARPGGTATRSSARRSPRSSPCAAGARVDGPAGPGRAGRRPAAGPEGSLGKLAASVVARRGRRDPRAARRRRRHADGRRQPARRRRRRGARSVPGPVDRRRHRRDPAQHHRRAGPRPAEGAGGRPRRARSATSTPPSRPRSAPVRRQFADQDRGERGVGSPARSGPTSSRTSATATRRPAGAAADRGPVRDRGHGRGAPCR